MPTLVAGIVSGEVTGMNGCTNDVKTPVQPLPDTLGGVKVFNDTPCRITPIIRIRNTKGYPAYYRTFYGRSLSRPQIVGVLEVGNTANATGLKSGWKSIPA